MKANELRLGNWVNSKIYGDYPIVGMTAFDENSHIFKSMEYYPKGNKIEDVHPIPLTEEWLLRFGFEKRWDYWNHPCSSFEIAKTLNQGYFNSVNNNEYIHGIPIHYIHQLQNLYFALTGEELTIK